MTPKQFKKFTKAVCIEAGENLMCVGHPGGGKTACGVQSALESGLEWDKTLHLRTPQCEDPTDQRGFPNVDSGVARFIPFEDMNQIMQAKEPTLCILDDFGQAPFAVQASYMQVLFGRRFGSHIMSPHVRFLVLTNDVDHFADVNGILEPVKSRCASIVRLETSVEDWLEWAISEDLPSELLAFVKMNPKYLLEPWEATNEMRNTPSPRTIAQLGRVYRALNSGGFSENEMIEPFSGAVGEQMSAQFVGFLKLKDKIPSVKDIIATPEKAKVPIEKDAQYFVAFSLIRHITSKTLKAILTYMDRLGEPEMTAFVAVNAVRNAKDKERKALMEAPGMARYLYSLQD